MSTPVLFLGTSKSWPRGLDLRERLPDWHLLDAEMRPIHQLVATSTNPDLSAKLIALQQRLVDDNIPAGDRGYLVTARAYCVNTASIGPDGAIESLEDDPAALVLAMQSHGKVVGFSRATLRRRLPAVAAALGDLEGREPSKPDPIDPHAAKLRAHRHERLASVLRKPGFGATDLDDFLIDVATECSLLIAAGIVRVPDTPAPTPVAISEPPNLF